MNQALAQADLFDSPLHGPVKNDRRMMVWNFFSLDTSRSRTETITYQDGDISIEVRAGPMGMATMADKELLIYIASLMVEKMNRGEVPDQTFTFTAHDFFRVCGTAAAGTAYDRIKGALDRLQGTQVRTNIETGGEGRDEWFSWIKAARLDYRKTVGGKRTLKGVTVELCDWLHRAILKDNRVLTYDRKYFDLTPLERRLYEIARAHCGHQRGFRINLEKLRQRVGTESDLRRFKYDLRKVADSGRIPEYGILLKGDPASPEVKAALERGTIKRRPKNAAVLVVFWNKRRYFDEGGIKAADGWNFDGFDLVD
ncbi:MAG: RepB family plasmid replication initiator protein [Candidatus Hydrogenedens sp.]|nr:RepB family plasmid replication initiator protein [Candidatus Hydrogenedens sp.]